MKCWLVDKLLLEISCYHTYKSDAIAVSGSNNCAIKYSNRFGSNHIIYHCKSNKIPIAYSRNESLHYQIESTTVKNCNLNQITTWFWPLLMTISSQSCTKLVFKLADLCWNAVSESHKTFIVKSERSTFNRVLAPDWQSVVDTLLYTTHSSISSRYSSSTLAFTQQWCLILHYITSEWFRMA